MNKLTFIAATGITSVALATAVVSPAFAWHPKGQIVKSVQNVTAGGALSDANSAATAVAAKPGDTLKYVIVVSNVGEADKDGGNDMAFVNLKDSLPAGVELASSPSQRQINESLGTIKPGKSVTKEYLVKVVAQKDGIIENQACFTGDSTVKDNPQKGCDSADVKVTVPPVVTPPAPVTPSKPITPVTPSKPITPVNPTAPAPVTPAPVAPATPVAPAPQQPASLPVTGPADVLMFASVAAVAGYALNVLRLKFRANG